MGRSWGIWVWVAWLPVAVWLCWEPFAWHVEYFRSPGPVFYSAVRWGIPALLVLGWAYLWVRRWWWRWEMRVLGLALVLAAGAYEPLATASVIGLALAALMTGHGVLGLVGPRIEAGLERLVLAATLGFGSLTLVLFGMGLVGWGADGLLWLAVAVPAAILGRFAKAAVWEDARAVDAAWRGDDTFTRPLAGIAAMGVAALTVPAWLVALAPAVAHDPIVMHLPAARHYAEAGALIPVPHLEYSFYPQSFELLMTPLYALAGSPGAQLLAPVFLMLTAGAFAVIGRQVGLGRGAAFLGAVCASAFPFLHWTGAVPKNDMAMQLYLLASLVAFLRGRQDGWRWMLVSVAFVSFAFGVKHVALFGAVAIGVLFLVWLRGQEGRWGKAVAWGGLFLTAGLIWHARTYVLTGNPVYPSMAVDAVEALRPDAVRAEGDERMPHWRIPWAVHFDGQRVFESPSPNPMGLLFVVLWPLVLMPGAGRRVAVRFLVAYALLYLLYWSMIWPVVRYAIAPVGIFAVLLAGRLWTVGESERAWRRGVAQATLAMVLVFSLLVIGILEANGPQLRYFAGGLDRDGYLRELLVAYPALDWVEDNVGPNERVVALNACSNLYGPEMERFWCESWESEQEARAFLLRAEEDWEYLILPTTEMGTRLAPEGGPLLYSDEEFRVFGWAGEER